MSNQQFVPQRPSDGSSDLRLTPQHASRDACSERFRFQHHKLDVYRAARRMARQCKVLYERVPRGYRSFADQLLRSAGQTQLLIAEGANRYTAGQKRQRFTEARGEAGEVAAAVELLMDLELIGAPEGAEVMELADRICAMLTQLIKRHR